MKKLFDIERGLDQNPSQIHTKLTEFTQASGRLESVYSLTHEKIMLRFTDLSPNCEVHSAYFENENDFNDYFLEVYEERRIDIWSIEDRRGDKVTRHYRFINDVFNVVDTFSSIHALREEMSFLWSAIKLTNLNAKNASLATIFVQLAPEFKLLTDEKAALEVLNQPEPETPELSWKWKLFYIGVTVGLIGGALLVNHISNNISFDALEDGSDATKLGSELSGITTSSLQSTQNNSTDASTGAEFAFAQEIPDITVYSGYTFEVDFERTKLLRGFDIDSVNSLSLDARTPENGTLPEWLIFNHDVKSLIQIAPLERSIKFFNNRLYGLTYRGRDRLMITYDVSVPSSPDYENELLLPDDWCTQIELSSDSFYVRCEHSVLMGSLTDNPSLTASTVNLNLPFEQMASIKIVNDYLIVTGFLPLEEPKGHSPAQLLIYSASLAIYSPAPENALLGSTLLTNDEYGDSDVNDMIIDGGYAYVLDGEYGYLYTVDIKNWNHPTQVATLSVEPQPLLNGTFFPEIRKFNESFLYMNDGEFLALIDKRQPANPILSTVIDSPGYFISDGSIQGYSSVDGDFHDRTTHGQINSVLLTPSLTLEVEKLYRCDSNYCVFEAVHDDYLYVADEGSSSAPTSIVPLGRYQLTGIPPDTGEYPMMIIAKNANREIITATFNIIVKSFQKELALMGAGALLTAVGMFAAYKIYRTPCKSAISYKGIEDDESDLDNDDTVDVRAEDGMELELLNSPSIGSMSS